MGFDLSSLKPNATREDYRKLRLSNQPVADVPQAPTPDETAFEDRADFMFGGKEGSPAVENRLFDVLKAPRQRYFDSQSIRNRVPGDKGLNKAVDWMEEQRREAMSSGATEAQSRIAQAYRNANPQFKENVPDREVYRQLIENHPNLKGRTDLTEEDKANYIRHALNMPDEDMPARDERGWVQKAWEGTRNVVGGLVTGMINRAATPYHTAPVSQQYRDVHKEIETLRDQYRAAAARNQDLNSPELMAIQKQLEAKMDQFVNLEAAQNFNNDIFTNEAIGWGLIASGEGALAEGGELLAPAVARSRAAQVALRGVAEFGEKIPGKSWLRPLGKWMTKWVAKPAAKGAVDMALFETPRALTFAEDDPGTVGERIGHAALGGAITVPLLHPVFGALGVAARYAIDTSVSRVLAAGGAERAAADLLGSHLKTDVPLVDVVPPHRLAALLVEQKFGPGVSRRQGGQAVAALLTRLLDERKYDPQQLAEKRAFIENDLPGILEKFKFDPDKSVEDEAVRIVQEHLREQGAAAGLSGAGLEQYVRNATGELDRLTLVMDKMNRELSAAGKKPAAAIAVAPGTDPVVPADPTPVAPGATHNVGVGTASDLLPKFVTDPHTGNNYPIAGYLGREGAPTATLVELYNGTNEDANPELKEALWRELYRRENGGKLPGTDTKATVKAVEPPSWRGGKKPEPLPIDTPAPGETPGDTPGTVNQDVVDLDVTIDGQYQRTNGSESHGQVHAATHRSNLADMIGDMLDIIISNKEAGATVAAMRDTARRVLLTLKFKPNGELTAVRQADGTIQYVELEQFLTDFINKVIDQKKYENPSWGQGWKPRPEVPVEAPLPTPEVDNGNMHVRDIKENLRVRNGRISRDETNIMPSAAPPHSPTRHQMIADAFHDMPTVPDPKDEAATRASYDALNREVRQQYQAILDAGYKIEVVEHDPYKNSQEMRDDIKNNRRLKVLAAPEGHHPYMSKEDTEMFRAVHDFFGHAAEGHQFGVNGEEGAFHVHASMFSPEALGAMHTETRAQNAWFHYGPYRHLPVGERPFAPQKAGILPRELWMDGLNPSDRLTVHQALIYDRINKGPRPAPGIDWNAGNGNHHLSATDENQDAWTRYASAQRIARENSEMEAQKAAREALRQKGIDDAAAAEQQRVVESAWRRARQVDAERTSRPARIAQERRLRNVARTMQTQQRYVDLGATDTPPAPRQKAEAYDAGLEEYRNLVLGHHDRMQTADDETLAQNGYWRNPQTGEAEPSPYAQAQLAQRREIARRGQRLLYSFGESPKTPKGQPIKNTYLIDGNRTHVLLNEGGDAVRVGGKGGRVTPSALSEVIRKSHAHAVAVEVSLTPVTVKGKKPEFDAARIDYLTKLGFYVREKSPGEMVFRMDPPPPEGSTLSPEQALQLSSADVATAGRLANLPADKAFVLMGASAPGSPLVP